MDASALDEMREVLACLSPPTEISTLQAVLEEVLPSLISVSFHPSGTDTELAATARDIEDKKSALEAESFRSTGSDRSSPERTRRRPQWKKSLISHLSSSRGRVDPGRRGGPLTRRPSKVFARFFDEGSVGDGVELQARGTSTSQMNRADALDGSERGAQVGVGVE